MPLAVHVVALAVVPEVIVAGRDFLAWTEVRVVLALAEEALVFTEAVVADGDIAVAIGALPVHKVREVIRIGHLGYHREELIHVDLVVILRRKPLPVSCYQAVEELNRGEEE